MANRPYFNFSGNELTEEFRDHQEDFKVLKALLDELQHRKTPKMRNLRTEIEATFKKTHENTISTSQTTHQKKPLDTFHPINKPQDTIKKSQGNNSCNDPQETSGKKTDEKDSSYLKNKKRETQHEEQEHHATRGKIRRPGKLTDVPEKRVFKLKNDIKLGVPKDTPLAVNYEAGVKALIEELRKKGSTSRQFLLEDGIRIHLDGHEIGYQFRFDEDVELFEGAAVIALIGGTKTEGRIVALQGHQLVISFKDDFGPCLASCLIRVDNTVMLEALRARLEKIAKGEVTSFNIKIAEAVIRNDGEELAPAHLPQGIDKDLNLRQQETISKMLSNNVFYLWGPPGTGKTRTLGALCFALFSSDKKVLLCSNTNQAVDQVLLKLCKQFGKRNQALIDGRIIRIGHMTLSELKKEWSEYITLDGIIERKSEALVKRKSELENKLDVINRKTERSREIAKAFAVLDGLTIEKKQMIDASTKAEKELATLIDNKKDIQRHITVLEKELATYQSAGSLKRIILRSLETIEKDISRAKAELQSTMQKINSDEQTKRSLKQKLDELYTVIIRYQQQLSGIDRKEIERQIEQAEVQARPLTEEIAAINRQLENIRKAVLENARIIGATVTKIYLSPQLFSGFHIVIVDEASMAMLPALFNAAGHVKEKVLISGDFRQLAPIVPTNQQAIVDAIGGDIFQKAGISGSNQKDGKRFKMLEEQYRMNEMICQLISNMMYDGLLTTALERKNKQFSAPPMPFNNPLTLIDTSPVWPFVNRDLFGSRYNLMHALAVRNLCRFFLTQKYVQDSRTLGVSTPYAAQAKILKRIFSSSEYENFIETGTVHHYQGDEKATMILDIPDSYGEWRAGIFLDADQKDDPGALLFNVAISRAQAHLIVFANLAYLDNKLPSHAVLREILANMQDKGTVLDVRDVLAMYPIMDDLRRYGRPFDLSPEAEKTGLFNQHDFDVVCQADFDRAKKGISIYSGFITPQRVASYEVLFRKKLSEGVIIRCVTRPPDRNGSIPIDMGKTSLDALENMGCIVDTRGEIHEKVIIIDDEIVWFGSLNPLSHNAKTDEMMARIEGKQLALQIAAFMSIEGGIKPDSASGLAYQKENPSSLCCDSRSAYMKGRYGPYWLCEDCGTTESINKEKRHTKGQRDQTKDAPICDKCGSPMVMRPGKFGQFYGCSRYPECKNTAKAK